MRLCTAVYVQCTAVYVPAMATAGARVPHASAPTVVGWKEGLLESRCARAIVKTVLDQWNGISSDTQPICHSWLVQSSVAEV